MSSIENETLLITLLAILMAFTMGGCILGFWAGRYWMPGVAKAWRDLALARDQENAALRSQLNAVNGVLRYSPGKAEGA